MTDFIAEYFVNPILYQDQYAPYNAYNTLAYTVAALVATYVVYRVFKRFGVAVDEDLARTVLPFVFFGAVLRVFEDGHWLPRVVEVFGVKLFPFVTPGIYIAIFTVLGVSAIASLLLVGRGNAKLLLSKIGIGLALVAFFALAFHFKFFAHGLAILCLAFVLLKAFEWLLNALKQKDLHSLESLAFFGQALDGSATFVATQFGSPTATYFEQHVVGGALIAGFGPIAFLLVKIAFGAAVVWLLRKEKAGQEEKNYALTIIAVLGIAPGLRDLLRLVVGV